ncbi:MAG TPA: family 78 glycoside hydrolase catalytic domain [Nocardioides sp.]|nr:family 78 glycoside hydrolase catalytic domain [Nocardioides sp.]
MSPLRARPLRVVLLAVVVLATVLPGGALPQRALAAGHGDSRVLDLRTENTTTPLGTDVERPRFSWVTRSKDRGVRQTAYRLVVSSTPQGAAAGDGDVWDSGVVTSEASAEVVYGGAALEPATRYFWRVWVRTTADRRGTWSGTTWFETGLGAQGWQGSSWLSVAPDAEDREPLTLDGADWVWHPEGNPPYAPEGDWFYRLPLTDGGEQPVSADVLVTADDSYQLFLDGEQVGSSPDGPHTWMRAQRYSLDLTGGDSVLAVRAHNSWEAAGAGIASPAGLLAKVRLTYADGSSRTIATAADSPWRSHDALVDGWARPGFDASGWSPVAQHAAYGSGPWGRGVTVPAEDDARSALAEASWIWYPDGTPPEAPAGTRYFRRAFEVDPDRELVSADLVMTADDRFVASLNGRQVGRSSTSGEAWREARVLPLSAVRPGRNVVAVSATNSNFASGAPSPAGLLGVVRLRYAGGEVELVPTDGSWRTNREAPEGWADPIFDDSTWAAAVVHAAYGSGPWGDNVVISEVPDAAPVFRTDFDLDRPVASARLYVAGAGLVDSRLNGSPVGDEVLSVSHTDYGHTVHYATHDVTPLLEQGANALLFELGRGFYAMTTRNSWNWDAAPWSQESPAVRAVLRVTYEDGTTEQVATRAADWRQTTGPTTYDSLYEGDFYDARRELPGADRPGYDDADWAVPAEVPGPSGTLTARVQPPVRVAKTLAPTRITQPSPGVYVAAFPQQVAGWARIEVEGQAGDEVRLRYGERLLDDGNVNSSTGFTGGEFQTDRYVLAGRPGGETWEPRFSYKGFKYVEITGWPSGAPTVDDVAARLVHTDVARTSTFDSSEPLFDQIHEGVLETVLNNLHHIPTDTPTYEKNGWTGDAQLGAEMFLRNFDTHSFLTKWLDDVSASRNADGRPALIAPDPDWNWGEAMQSPTWHAAYVLIPWWLYEYTGDTRVVEKHYEGIVRYLRLEHSVAEGHISSTGLGDYMSPDQVGNPPEDMRVSATAYVYEMTKVAAQMAELLGRAGDRASLLAEAARIKDAFNQQFYDREQHVYRDASAGYRQTHNVLALAFGLVPEGDEQHVADNLARDVREVRDGHLWTGVLGTKYLLPILTEYGHGDLAYRVATQVDYPSWGRWFESAEGSTTMWEAWDDYRSRNHYFLGTIDDWFAEDLVGIEPAAPGYREISVEPHPLGRLTHASGSTRTPLGRVASSWRKSGETFTLDVVVPVGATAHVSVPVHPGRVVSVNGVLAEQARGVTVGERADGRATFTVGSGTWRFRTELVLTDPAQCRDGGWRSSTLPVYRNQGECVSELAPGRRS